MRVGAKTVHSQAVLVKLWSAWSLRLVASQSSLLVADNLVSTMRWLLQFRGQSRLLSLDVQYPLGGRLVMAQSLFLKVQDKDCPLLALLPRSGTGFAEVDSWQCWLLHPCKSLNHPSSSLGIFNPWGREEKSLGRFRYSSTLGNSFSDRNLFSDQFAYCVEPSTNPTQGDKHKVKAKMPSFILFLVPYRAFLNPVKIRAFNKAACESPLQNEATTLGSSMEITGQTAIPLVLIVGKFKLIPFTLKLQ